MLYVVRENVILQIIEKWLLPLLVFIIVPGVTILAVIAYLVVKAMEVVSHRSIEHKNDHDN